MELLLYSLQFWFTTQAQCVQHLEAETALQSNKTEIEYLYPDTVVMSREGVQSVLVFCRDGEYLVSEYTGQDIE